MREWVQKIKDTKAYRWHSDYLKDKEQSNFHVYGTAVVGMLMGNHFELGSIAMLSVFLYIADFWRWNLQNKDKIQDKYLQEEPFGDLKTDEN